MVAALERRLHGGSDAVADEPTGLMTHHAAHDEALWRFLDRLLAVTKSHRAVRWLAAREAFAL